MSADIPVGDVRHLVNPENPFAVGKYYSRPAPVHVLNGMLAAALGVGDESDNIRRMFRVKADRGDIDESLFPFLQRSDIWAESRSEFDTLRRDLRVVFDPDRKVYPTRGSPFPVHPGFITKDESDDGFGPLVWQMIKEYGAEETTLTDVVTNTASEDPISVAAEIIASKSDVQGKRQVPKGDNAWFTDRGPQAGSVLAESLSRFIYGTLKPKKRGPQRLLQLQHLGRAGYLSTVLSVVLGPATWRNDEGQDSVNEIGSLVVWAGTPPGDPNHAFVKASKRSFQDAIVSLQEGLSRALEEAVTDQKVASTVPDDEVASSKLRAQYIQGGGDPDRYSRIRKYCREAGIDISGERLDREACGRLVTAGYDGSLLTSAVRSMGNKIGFVGPSRGAASPRFVCETPLLATLVRGLCPSKGMPFKEFIDKARDQLGLIFGVGSDDRIAERLPFWEGGGVGRDLLKKNQDRLKYRLVRSGLATEYSDGNTEVRYDY